MLKRLFALLMLTCLLLTLAGCNSSIRDTVEGKDTTLPPLRIDSTLICSVVSVNGNLCQALVLEGNNNYDKDDTVYITFESVKKDQSLFFDDVITFTYNYVTDVSAHNNKPHIKTAELTIIKNYTPPTTVAE